MEDKSKKSRIARIVGICLLLIGIVFMVIGISGFTNADPFQFIFCFFGIPLIFIGIGLIIVSFASVAIKKGIPVVKEAYNNVKDSFSNKPKVTFCPYCGTKNNENDKTCSGCRAPLK